MKKWYKCEHDADDLIDMKTPSFEEIKKHYVQSSCVKEPDASFDCVSCVVNFLLTEISARNVILNALKPDTLVQLRAKIKDENHNI